MTRTMVLAQVDATTISLGLLVTLILAVIGAIYTLATKLTAVNNSIDTFNTKLTMKLDDINSELSQLNREFRDHTRREEEFRGWLRGREGPPDSDRKESESDGGTEAVPATSTDESEETSPPDEREGGTVSVQLPGANNTALFQAIPDRNSLIITVSFELDDWEMFFDDDEEFKLFLEKLALELKNVGDAPVPNQCRNRGFIIEVVFNPIKDDALKRWLEGAAEHLKAQFTEMKDASGNTSDWE